MALDASHNQPSDEIDLRELCISLWQSKVLILSITVVIACIAAAYAFLSTPIYEASVRLLPPKASDLASYNSATQLTGDAISGIVDQGSSRAVAQGIRELTTKAAYESFLQQLDSDSIKLAFFEKYYLATYGKNSTETDRERLWKRLSKELVISLPKKAGDVVATVTFEGSNAKTIADWANRYVAIAATTTKKNLLQDLASEVKVRSQGINDQIVALRKVAQTQRETRIVRLENALAVAKSIGLESPPLGTPLIAINNTNTNDSDSFANGSMMYLRGAKALQSELELLKARKNDDAYIPDMDNLLIKKSLLTGIDLNPEHFAVIDIDRSATPPEDPTKPKKAMILALGIILGGILGIMSALIRNIFK